MRLLENTGNQFYKQRYIYRRISRASTYYLLLLEAAIEQDGVVVDGVGVEGVDCRRLLIERLCPGNIAPSLVSETQPTTAVVTGSVRRVVIETQEIY